MTATSNTSTLNDQFPKYFQIQTRRHFVELLVDWNQLTGFNMMATLSFNESRKTTLQTIWEKQQACLFWEKRIFHFKLSSISRHPSDGQKALMESFKISGCGWACLTTPNQKILMLDLSLLWVISICKYFEEIRWFLPEILMIKEPCNLIGQDRFGDKALVTFCI